MKEAAWQKGSKITIAVAAFLATGKKKIAIVAVMAGGWLS
jgi:hypothetical protein